jgi:hypothetical protein
MQKKIWVTELVWAPDALGDLTFLGHSCVYLGNERRVSPENGGTGNLGGRRIFSIHSPIFFRMWIMI